MFLRTSLSTLLALSLWACGGEDLDLLDLSSKAEVGDKVLVIKHLGYSKIPTEARGMSLNELQANEIYALDLINEDQEVIPGLRLTFLQQDKYLVPPIAPDLDAPPPSLEELAHQAPLKVVMVLAATTKSKTLMDMPEHCIDPGCAFENEMLSSGKELGQHENEVCLPNFEPTDAEVRLVFIIHESMSAYKDYFLQVERAECDGSLPTQQVQ